MRAFNSSSKPVSSNTIAFSKSERNVTTPQLREPIATWVNSQGGGPNISPLGETDCCGFNVFNVYSVAVQIEIFTFFFCNISSDFLMIVLNISGIVNSIIMGGLNNITGGFKSRKHINIYVKIGDPTSRIFNYRWGSWNASSAINEESL